MTKLTAAGVYLKTLSSIQKGFSQARKDILNPRRSLYRDIATFTDRHGASLSVELRVTVPVGIKPGKDTPLRIRGNGVREVTRARECTLRLREDHGPWQLSPKNGSSGLIVPLNGSSFKYKLPDEVRSLVKAKSRERVLPGEYDADLLSSVTEACVAARKELRAVHLIKTFETFLATGGKKGSYRKSESFARKAPPLQDMTGLLRENGPAEMRNATEKDVLGRLCDWVCSDGSPSEEDWTSFIHDRAALEAYVAARNKAQ